MIWPRNPKFDLDSKEERRVQEDAARRDATWINTRVVMDIASGDIVERLGYWHYGDIAECKGDHSAAEQSNADALRTMETQQLMKFMNQQWQIETQGLQQVNQIIANQGMTPQEQSAMTSIAMNQLPQDFNQMFGNVSEQLAARGVSGGQNAGGGQIASRFGSLGAMEDFMKSNLLENIQLQKSQDLRNAINTKLGIANSFGQFGMGFNQGALGSLNAGVNAAANADAAQTSWMGPLFGAFGSLGGGILSNPGIFGKPTGH